jgi:hypothetical protein
MTAPRWRPPSEAAIRSLRARARAGAEATVVAARAGPTAGAGVVATCVGAMAVAATLALVLQASILSTPAVAGALPVNPPLASMVISRPLPGYRAAPAGPTNGPLTAEEFASQSSAPRRAERQFEGLANQPHFGAYIRLWADGSGPGRGSNDLAVLVFRIPRLDDAESFAAGLQAPFAGSSSIPFDVPSVPSAHGYSVHISAPVRAVEQIVVFRAGQYVVMTELASASSASNPGALTPSEAISVSFLQYQAIRTGDPRGSSDVNPAPAAPTPTAPTGGGISAWVVVLVVLVVAVGGLAVLAIRRRRGPASLSDRLAGDPWGPGGVFEAFGAVIPGDGNGSGQRHPVRDVDADPLHPARMVPALVAAPLSAPSAELLGLDGGEPEPTGSHAGADRGSEPVRD